MMENSGLPGESILLVPLSRNEERKPARRTTTRAHPASTPPPLSLRILQRLASLAWLFFCPDGRDNAV